MQKKMDDILKHASILFCENNYDNVTIREIAEAAGVSPAEIYHYFDGKDAILKAVYQRYCDVLLENAPPPDVYLPILEKGTAEDIVNIFTFNMPEPQDININAVRILMARRLSDKRAKDAYLRNAWEPSLAYIKEVLCKGVEIGRLNMNAEDIAAFSHHILALREYTATVAMVVADKRGSQRINRDMLEQMSFLILPYMTDGTIGPAVAETPNILAQAIRAESLAVGKYYHYYCVLKKNGQEALATLVDEIVENILDEINTLYNFSERGTELLDSAELLKLIAENERIKRIEAEKAAANAGNELRDVFREIVELAQQHERICLNIPNQEDGVDHA